MKAKKILFITQEMTPYVPDSELAAMGRELPQEIQEKGREIRTFMPKWGNINERRNQLHEVIRLSGMNLIIDDTDHQGGFDSGRPDASIFHRQRRLLPETPDGSRRKWQRI